MKGKPFKVGHVTFGGKELALILGPCVIESEKAARRTAARLVTITARLGLPFVFKASYDKANRTSGRSFRGPGPEEGCRILAAIREEFGIPVTTDVHSPQEVEIAADHVDLLQIPAFLCRQTDLISAAARSGRAVNVKKGQFLSPWEVKPIADKLLAEGCRKFCFTERGTTFGYNNLVADMRSIPWVQEQGYHVIFDATHSVQRPGGGGDRTTGDGRLAPVLACAAVAAGASGVFLETHENPAKAPSDGPNQIPLAQLPGLLRKLAAIRHAL
ncbi:MAG: 3-deoxy-8-phosphooctulonate synthase [Chthoniobacterales bacterium]|nr:3-deoxy-8-phosphooctulonate synthase [Chthoniobacterales bacterium]